MISVNVNFLHRIRLQGNYGFFFSSNQVIIFLVYTVITLLALNLSIYNMKGTERSVTYMLKSNLILKNLSVVKEINYDLELPL